MYSQSFIFLSKAKKGCKNIYNILNNRNCDNNYIYQWNHDLSITIDNVTWKRIFFLCFNTILDNKLIWFQYKLLYQILGTNKLLYQIGRYKENACQICNTDTETITHLFTTCEVAKQLWADLNNWLGWVINKHLSQALLEIILDHLKNDNHSLPINYIILTTKYYIFVCAVKLKTPSVNEFILKLKACYQEQLLLSINTGKEEEFRKNWAVFSKPFDSGSC